MSKPVQAVQRALLIMETTAASGAGATTIEALAKQTGLARATTHRLVHSLVSQNLLALSGKSVRLGFGVLGMGFDAVGSSEFTRSATAVLTQLSLKVGETAVLGHQQPDANTVEVLAVAHAGGALRLAIEVGDVLDPDDAGVMHSIKVELRVRLDHQPLTLIIATPPGRYSVTELETRAFTELSRHAAMFG